MSASTLPEHHLVERARRGDEWAFARLVRRHEHQAHRRAYRLTHDAEDARDATQDGFLNAYLALARFRYGAPFGPWLARIVSNEAHDRRDQRVRHVRLVQRAEETAERATAPAAERRVLDAERRSALHAAVRALAPAQRDVVICRFFLDLSEAETAAALAIPEGTVKSRLSRALDALRVQPELREAV